MTRRLHLAFRIAVPFLAACTLYTAGRALADQHHFLAALYTASAVLNTFLAYAPTAREPYTNTRYDQAVTTSAVLLFTTTFAHAATLLHLIPDTWLTLTATLLGTTPIAAYALRAEQRDATNRGTEALKTAIYLVTPHEPIDITTYRDWDIAYQAAQDATNAARDYALTLWLEHTSLTFHRRTALIYARISPHRALDPDVQALTIDDLTTMQALHHTLTP